MKPVVSALMLSILADERSIFASAFGGLTENKQLFIQKNLVSNVSSVQYCGLNVTFCPSTKSSLVAFMQHYMFREMFSSTHQGNSAQSNCGVQLHFHTVCSLS